MGLCKIFYIFMYNIKLFSFFHFINFLLIFIFKYIEILIGILHCKTLIIYKDFLNEFISLLFYFLLYISFFNESSALNALKIIENSITAKDFNLISFD